MPPKVRANVWLGGAVRQSRNQEKACRENANTINFFAQKVSLIAMYGKIKL